MTFTVTDQAGVAWPNLVGVFRREFPIVVADVIATGEPQAVTYDGDRFTIGPRTS